MSARFASGVPPLHHAKKRGRTVAADGPAGGAVMRALADWTRARRCLAARVPGAQESRQLGSACRVTVDAQRIDRESQRRAVCRRDLSVGHHAQRAADHCSGVVNNRPRCGPGCKRSVWRIGAVGKAFRRDAKTGCRARREELGARQAEENERSVEGTDRARDRIGEGAIAGRHVVKRAMSLHVCERHAFRGGDRRQRARSGRQHRDPRPHSATRGAPAARIPRGRDTCTRPTSPTSRTSTGWPRKSSPSTAAWTS